MSLEEFDFNRNKFFVYFSELTFYLESRNCGKLYEEVIEQFEKEYFNELIPKKQWPNKKF